MQFTSNQPLTLWLVALYKISSLSVDTFEIEKKEKINIIES